MPVVTTSNRGQIVIPRDVRRQLNILPGKKILVKVQSDRAILLPLPDDPVEHFVTKNRVVVPVEDAHEGDHELLVFHLVLTGLPVGEVEFFYRPERLIFDDFSHF